MDDPAESRPTTRQVLFVQGGGAGTHDEWDNVLVDSLRAHLGPGYEVRYPRMPEEADPSYSPWQAAIRRELADLDEGAVVVGHSIGATILLQALIERPPPRRLAAIVLIAAPFVGPGGWPGSEFELSGDVGDWLPSGVPVHVFHGTEDETAPPAHAALYAAAIPRHGCTCSPGATTSWEATSARWRTRSVSTPDPARRPRAGMLDPWLLEINR